MQGDLKKLLASASLLMVIIFNINAKNASDKFCVGCWKFEEGQGNTVMDSSGNKNDGKIIEPNWIKSKKNSVLRTGNASYVEIPNSSTLNLQGALSLEMWVCFGERKNNGWNYILKKGVNDKNISYCLRDLPNHLYFVLFGEKDGKRINWCWNIKHNYYQDGIFHHVVVTYDKDNSVKFYVDGKNIPIVNQMRGDYPEKHFSNDNPLYIGKRFNGFIGHMAIYNKALPYEQIESDYKQDKKSYTGINLSKAKHSVDMHNYSFQQWEGKFNPQWRTGISFLWWYGKLNVFHDKNAEIEIYREAYPSFQINCIGKGDGVYGVQFPWIKALEKGFIYKFTIGINSETLPDIVTVEGKIVWEKGKGTIKSAKGSDSLIIFNYVPDKNKNVKIAIIKKCKMGIQNKLIFPDAQSCDYMRSWRIPFKKTVPEYRRFSLSRDVKYVPIASGISCRIIPEEILTVDKFTMPMLETMKLPYATSEVVIFPGHSAPGQLKINGIKGISIRRKDIERTAELIPILKEEGIKHILLDWGNLGILLAKTENDVIAKRNEQVAKAAKTYLSEIPGSQVYIMFSEDTGFCFGTWPHGLECSPILQLPQYKGEITGVEKIDPSDYDDIKWWPRKKIFKAFKLVQDYLEGFYKKLKANTGNEGKVQIILLADKAAYQPSHLYNAKVNIVMNKHIHRQNVNILTALNRGESLAYGKKYGFVCDFWDRMYPSRGSLDEIDQVLKVYFHAGGTYFWDEITTFHLPPSERHPRIGVTPYDFCRYTATHVKLGEQKSLIGIMRGSGDEWGIGAIASPSNNESQPLGAEWKRRLFRDFNLLNIVFPNYGNYYRTFTDRLCTGTPYGPVNMIPWDIPLDKLEKYKVVFFLGGPNAIDNKQYENLKKYVKNGGVLIMAIGQLRKEDGSFYKTDFSDLFGVKLGDIRLLHYPQRETLIIEDPKEYPYTHLDLADSTAEVRFRLTDSSPWVVENHLGKGKAYLFATEHLTQYGDAPAMDIMKSELEKTKWLTFSKGSSWLEYMVQKKGDCYILPIFNHGNVGFPSGNGKKTGPWNGRVTLKLDKFEFPKGELTVYESVYVPDEKIPYKLVKIASTQKYGKLSFNIKIDKFSEIVIGPSEKVKQEYFSKKD